MSQWKKGSRVTFQSSHVEPFLDDLAKKTAPHNIPVYVTSSYRSPHDQARVVCNNVASTGGQNLSIYGARTGEMYRQHCPNLEPLEAYEAQKLAANIARDPNYTGHGTGKAVDLSVSRLTYDQKIKYKALIESMGARVLWEKHPEHFHVWIKSYRSKWTSPKNLMILGSVLLLGTGGGLLWWSSGKKKKKKGRKKKGRKK